MNKILKSSFFLIIALSLFSIAKPGYPQVMSEQEKAFQKAVDEEKERKIRNGKEQISWEKRKEKDLENLKEYDGILGITKREREEQLEKEKKQLMLLSQAKKANRIERTKIQEAKKRALKLKTWYPLSVLRKSYDEMRETTWYYSYKSPRHTWERSAIFPFLLFNKNGVPLLILKIQYVSSSWLFVKHCILRIDGENTILYPETNTVHRDNEAYKIWEWFSLIIGTPQQYQMLKSLIVSEKAKLRFEGNEYYHDLTITSKDKKAIKDILVALENYACISKDSFKIKEALGFTCSKEQTIDMLDFYDYPKAYNFLKPNNIMTY
jgi:hypothetical protein